MPPMAYRPLAKHYEKLARQLNDAADRFERGTGDRAPLQQAIGSTRGVADMVQEYLVNGLPKAAAYDAVSKICGQSVETVSTHYLAKCSRP